MNPNLSFKEECINEIEGSNRASVKKIVLENIKS